MLSKSSRHVSRGQVHVTGRHQAKRLYRLFPLFLFFLCPFMVMASKHKYQHHEPFHPDAPHHPASHHEPDNPGHGGKHGHGKEWKPTSTDTPSSTPSPDSLIADTSIKITLPGWTEADNFKFAAALISVVVFWFLAAWQCLLLEEEATRAIESSAKRHPNGGSKLDIGVSSMSSLNVATTATTAPNTQRVRRRLNFDEAISPGRTNRPGRANRSMEPTTPEEANVTNKNIDFESDNSHSKPSNQTVSSLFPDASGSLGPSPGAGPFPQMAPVAASTPMAGQQQANDALSPERAPPPSGTKKGFLESPLTNIIITPLHASTPNKDRDPNASADSLEGVDHFSGTSPIRASVPKPAPPASNWADTSLNAITLTPQRQPPPTATNELRQSGLNRNALTPQRQSTASNTWQASGLNRNVLTPQRAPPAQPPSSTNADDPWRASGLNRIDMTPTPAPTPLPELPPHPPSTAGFKPGQLPPASPSLPLAVSSVSIPADARVTPPSVESPQSRPEPESDSDGPSGAAN